jgi:hypothetical protein
LFLTVWRGIFVHQRDKITESYRNLRNKELGNWCFSSHRVRVRNPGVFRQAVHEAHEEEKGDIGRRFVGKPEGKGLLRRPMVR